MTNLEHIRTLPADELAKLLISHTYEIFEDYYFDGESEIPYESYTEVWKTSDGNIFHFEEDALQAQIEHLESELESL